MHGKTNLVLAMAVVFAAGLAGSASATITYDDNVTPNVIFGSGNANGGFTVDRANDVELGLRAKLRHNASGAPENTFNSNGDGTYSFNTGVAPTQSFPTAEWSFEWSISTFYNGISGNVLNGLTYELGLDFDPSASATFLAFDPINVNLADHAIGTNLTPNGGGLVAGTDAEYATLISQNTVAQNSWKPHWFLPGFDPTVDGTYTIYLAAFDETGAQLARTEIDIIVGDGGACDPVPEPASMALLGLGLAGLGVRRMRKRG